MVYDPLKILSVKDLRPASLILLHPRSMNSKELLRERPCVTRSVAPSAPIALSNKLRFFNTLFVPKTFPNAFAPPVPNAHLDRSRDSID
jgi:hypothetical protein